MSSEPSTPSRQQVDCLRYVVYLFSSSSSSIVLNSKKDLVKLGSCLLSDYFADE